MAASLASAGGSLVADRISRLGLTVALPKTEAVFFHGPRQRQPPDAHINVAGVRIGVQAQMKYLGLILDSRWRFGPHFSGLSKRLLKTAGALSWLLPNIGGPGNRIINRIGHLEERENAAALRRSQRAIAQRVAMAYRTVSLAAACALAGTPPWELEAWVLARVYEWTAEQRALGQRPGGSEREAVREEARDAVDQHWTEDLATATFGRRTLDAIGPVLSGHGCFGSYFHRIGREESPSCHQCGAAVDTAEHTLEVCPSWAEPRRALVAAVGNDLSLPGVIIAMLGSEEAWAAVASFCEDVMSQKEAAEREREDDPLAPALRRRKRGGRRRTQRPPSPASGGVRRAASAGALPPASQRTPLAMARYGRALRPQQSPPPPGGA
nr:uncharacterized protein LOC116767321 [Danaus plexippus plexippus]